MGECPAPSLVLPLKGGGEKMLRTARSMREASATAALALREQGIETPELDARLLLCHAAGLSHEAYVSAPDDALAPDAAMRFGGFIERRIAGEPVSRIVGRREFYGRLFRIDPNTLDPRPDTETLIEAALSLLDREAPLTLLDLGTGSGCILVTLLAELPKATGVGIDQSRSALDIARANAEALGMAERADFFVSNWLDAVGGKFDLVVANPPYLSAVDMSGLAPEVRDHDPSAALDGGQDGLSAYRHIVPKLRQALRPGGIALLEIGPSQAGAVSRLFAEADLAPEGGHWLWRDLAGRPRVVGTRTKSLTFR